MAGSLNHIVDRDGSFKMNLIENRGDAYEALQECHQIIAWLLPFAAQSIHGCDATGALKECLHDLGYPDAWTPILDTELMGPNGAIRCGTS